MQVLFPWKKGSQMINTQKLHALYGLKWNPFLAEVPATALIKGETATRFCWRIEQVVMDGGFALISGEPGSGKSVLLRQLQAHLSEIPELAVRVISRPQSGISDFYRELSDIYDIPLKRNNRWGSFNSLRIQWLSHIKASMFRPVLLLDEAQEAHEDVLSELRLLSSVDLDSKSIVAVVLAGDNRLSEKLRQTALLPLESRVRIRLHLDKRPQSELAQILTEVLIRAGNSELMTPLLIQTAAEHSMGNLRALMMMCNELLTHAAERSEKKLDETLFFEVFNSAVKKKRNSK